jgi:curved DNA-binding protein CbpA
MTGGNLYDVLGVSRNATPEEIRQAYVLRSKVMHPDRFDQVSQPKEWKLANELLQELNRANAVLRDKSQRKIYDESVFAKASSPPPFSKQAYQEPYSPRHSSTSPPPFSQRQANQRTGETDTQIEHPFIASIFVSVFTLYLIIVAFVIILALIIKASN